jgi:hypothetical protein
MAAKGKQRRRRATKIKYVVSITDSVPSDLEEKVSDAHARAILAKGSRAPSESEGREIARCQLASFLNAKKLS